MTDNVTMQLGNACPPAPRRPARPAITLDIERYQAMLDMPDVTDKEKQAFLEALSSIIIAFVDLGFSVHPLDLACGQNAGSESEDALLELSLKDTFSMNSQSTPERSRHSGNAERKES